MFTQNEELSSQQKINARNQMKLEKTIRQAKSILKDSRSQKLLTHLLKYLYIHIPKNEHQLSNPKHFIDHLYLLNYAVTSMIVNWKISNKDTEPYVNDPDLTKQVMEILYQDGTYNDNIETTISKTIIHYLISLKNTFETMMDEIYQNQAVKKELNFLMTLHSTSTNDACDHFVKTCYDRAKLIDEFLMFATRTQEENVKPLSREVVINYLSHFYGGNSLKVYLPKELATPEEKMLAELIASYAHITENKPLFNSGFLFLPPRKSYSEVAKLLNAMEKTILQYQRLHKQIPYYMTNILWRVNGLHMPQNQAQQHQINFRSN